MLPDLSPTSRILALKRACLSMLHQTVQHGAGFVRDDRAVSAVEYAAVAGLGALGAMSAAHAMQQSLAHTLAVIADALVK